MSALGSGQNLGGGAVVVTYDDSQVVAGLARTKAMVQTLVASPVMLQVAIDPASVTRLIGTIRAIGAPSLSIGATVNARQVRADFLRLLYDLQADATNNPIYLNVIGGAGGFGGGGGRGPGGGGGGGGGRGGIGPNYFSNRGIGRLIGNATAGFAIYEGVRVADGLAEAGQITSHPERIQRGFQSDNGRDVMQDRFVGGESQALATAKGQEKYLQTLESLPLIGALGKLADTAFGLSDSLKDEQEVTEKAIKAHLKLMDRHEQDLDYAATATGNVGEASQRVHQREVDKVRMEAQKVLDDPHSSAEGIAQAQQSVTDAKDIEQNKMKVEAQHEQARRLNQNDRLYSLDEKKKADEAQTAKNDPLAMQYRQKAERRELLDQYREKFAGVNPENQAEQGRVTKEYQAAAGELGAKQQGETARDVETRENAIASALASGQASQKKIAHDGYAAQMIEFEAHSKQKLAEIHDGGGQETQAVKYEIDQQRLQMKAAHDEEINDKQESYQDRMQAAAMQGQHQDFQAGLMVSTNEQEREIAKLPPGLREEAMRALGAETREKFRAHQEQVSRQSDRLGVEEASAKLRMNDQNLEASAVQTVYDQQAAAEQATPELRLQTERTAKAKLDEALRNLKPVGGGEARAIGQHEYVGDVTGKLVADRNAAQKDLQAASDKMGKNIARDAEKAAKEGGAFGGADPNHSAFKEAILKKLDDLVNLYSGTALAGSP